MRRDCSPSTASTRPAAGLAGAEAHGRAVDRRGSRAAEGALGGAPRNPRQSRAARPHRDTAAASPRPGCRAARIPAAPGRRSPEPTAAPVRLIVSPRPPDCGTPSRGRSPARSVRPAFTVAVSKSRTALPAQFTLEWNPDERSFQERRAENPVPVVPVSQHRARSCGKDWDAPGVPVRAKHAAGRQPPGEAIPSASPPWMSGPRRCG